MSTRVGIEVSLAAAEAVRLADVDVVAAYPITPQTHIVERLAELVAEGELDAEYIAVESEHSAISASLGAAMAGGRTFTATASQGLALMHEILFMASSLRLPVVMAVVNRALSAPINIWADHSDIMPERDTGWIQLFAENGQEVFDLIIQSFKLAEDHRILLPVMVSMDGFSLSHVIESVSMLDQQEVDSFLPHIHPARILDPDKPRTVGSFGAQDIYPQVKWQQEEAIRAAALVLDEIWSQYHKMFGRRYRPVETYATEDAELILVTMGAVGETARSAVEEMRAEGMKVGVVRIRLWRPFPYEEFFRAVRSAGIIAVLDRALMPGTQGGPVGVEVRSALYGRPEKPAVLDFVGGLGGREINRKTFREMVNRSLLHESDSPTYTLLDVR